MILSKEQIKAKIEEIAQKVMSDKDILNKFNAEPVKTIEDILGVDLPDDTVMRIVEGVKAKITVNDVTSTVSKLKNLFK